MVPKITEGGGNFKGAFRYYMHDKGAETRHRVNEALAQGRVGSATAHEHGKRIGQCVEQLGLITLLASVIKQGPLDRRGRPSGEDGFAGGSTAMRHDRTQSGP